MKKASIILMACLLSACQTLPALESLEAIESRADSNCAKLEQEIFSLKAIRSKGLIKPGEGAIVHGLTAFALPAGFFVDIMSGTFPLFSGTSLVLGAGYQYRLQHDRDHYLHEVDSRVLSLSHHYNQQCIR